MPVPIGDKRKNAGPRRQVNPATSSQNYSADDVEFLKAIDAYKREARRPHPTWSEVLEVLKSLGYRKVAPGGPLPLAPRKR